MCNCTRRIVEIKHKDDFATKLVKGLAVAKAIMTTYATYVVTKSIVKSVKEGNNVSVSVGKVEETKGE